LDKDIIEVPQIEIQNKFNEIETQKVFHIGVGCSKRAMVN